MNTLELSKILVKTAKLSKESFFNHHISENNLTIADILVLKVKIYEYTFNISFIINYDEKDDFFLVFVNECTGKIGKKTTVLFKSSKMDLCYQLLLDYVKNSKKYKNVNPKFYECLSNYVNQINKTSFFESMNNSVHKEIINKQLRRISIEALL